MVLLEIEQKFSFCLSKMPKFVTNRGTPPFRHLEFRKNHLFTDTYFDTANVLSKNGVYVRERHGVLDEFRFGFEAKKQVSGNYIRSTFEEFTDVDDIHHLVKQYFLDAPGAEEQFGLHILAKFQTERRNFLVDEKFSIALNETDFGHSVEEVEILTEQDSDQAHEEIDAFMAEYPWFFNEEKPKSKLTAYFEKFGMYTMDTNREVSEGRKHHVSNGNGWHQTDNS